MSDWWLSRAWEEVHTATFSDDDILAICRVVCAHINDNVDGHDDPEWIVLHNKLDQLSLEIRGK